jgi:hypothetical protein
MGWIFARIRSSEFLRSPAQAPVFGKLQMLEIPPVGDSTEEERTVITSHDVIDRLIRRAEELCKNWSKANGAGARSPARVSAASASSA